MVLAKAAQANVESRLAQDDRPVWEADRLRGDLGHTLVRKNVVIFSTCAVEQPVTRSCYGPSRWSVIEWTGWRTMSKP